MRRRPLPRCERLLSVIARYSATPLRCTEGAVHDGPHVYDENDPGPGYEGRVREAEAGRG
jgi:hypothetical protein